MRKMIFVLFVTIFVMAMCTGCGVFVSSDNVARAAEKQGYRDVKITSKHIFFVNFQGCGNDDNAAFNANGVNAVGERVDIVICAGWPFKGVTVRTN